MSNNQTFVKVEFTLITKLYHAIGNLPTYHGHGRLHEELQRLHDEGATAVRRAHKINESIKKGDALTKKITTAKPITKTTQAPSKIEKPFPIQLARAYLKEHPKASKKDVLDYLIKEEVKLETAKSISHKVFKAKA